MESRNIFKDKAFWGILLVCFVAVAAIAGAISLDNRNKKKIVQSEETTQIKNERIKQEKKKEVPAAKQKKNIVNTKKQVKEAENKKKIAAKKETNNEIETTNKKKKKEIKKKAASSPVSAAVASAKLQFSEKSKLVWPVEGQVLIPYSMDTTTFFPTLNEYKCSDSIVIQAAKDMQVKSAAKSVISKKGTNEEIGNYVTLNMGNGYELTYGQIKDCKKEVGEVVEQGEVLATVAEPSKYYQSEGYNLYLKLTQNGTSLDPLNQLDYTDKTENNIFYED